VLALGGMLPLALLAFVGLAYDFKEQTSLTHQRALETTRALATAVDAEIDRSIAALRVLATSEALDRGDIPAFEAAARRAVASQPGWRFVSLAGLDGRHLVNTFFKPGENVFNPDIFFTNPNTRWAFEGVRLFGAVLVVPFMEELFWRDFCWRSIIAPNDFKLAGVGEWDWKAFVIVPLIFAVVHGNCWLTAIGWGLMIGWLLAYTKSLGACIIAHATTNLLLGVYVLYSKQWSLW